MRAAELGYEAANILLSRHGYRDADGCGDVEAYNAAFNAWCGGKIKTEVGDLPQGRWKLAFDRLRIVRNRMAHLDYQRNIPAIAKRVFDSRAAATRALDEDFDILFSPDLTREFDLIPPRARPRRP